MRRIVVLLAGMFFAIAPALADDVVPATTDDVKQFDRRVQDSARDKKERELQENEREGVESPVDDVQAGNHHQRGKDQKDAKKEKEKRDNFGRIVSTEAKRLKDGDQDKRKEFGKWVSNQRRQDDKKNSNSSEHGGSGSSGGSGDDGRKSGSGSDGSGSSGRGGDRKH